MTIGEDAILRRAEDSTRSTPSCRSTVATSSPNYLLTTTSPRSSISPTRVWANTLRALASDLGYLEAWRQLATGAPLPWPAPESLLLKFVAHHLGIRSSVPTIRPTAMPAEVGAELRAERLLRACGPHAPGTVRRRLTIWSILTRWRGLTGALVPRNMRQRSAGGRA
ncbi:hypothetical protein ABIE78_003291 [Sinorhizobium fredii]